jgi:hypothetical protein
MRREPPPPSFSFASRGEVACCFGAPRPPRNAARCVLVIPGACSSSGGARAGSSCTNAAHMEVPSSSACCELVGDGRANRRRHTHHHYCHCRTGYLGNVPSMSIHRSCWPTSTRCVVGASHGGSRPWRFCLYHNWSIALQAASRRQ